MVPQLAWVSTAVGLQTQGWEIFSASFLLPMSFSVWGESLCWIGDGTYVSVWSHPPSVSQGRMAECCCSFCPVELQGGCIFFAITDTSNLCFKTSLLKLRRKNISLLSQHRYVLLVEAKGCSACLSALQHQQICLTGTFRHLFAPR